MPAVTIDQSFRAAVERVPSAAFIDRITGAGQRETTSYGQAAARIAATVERLRSLGVTRGDMIVCYTDDIVESIYFFLACFHMGVVPVPLAPSFSVGMLSNIARRTRARAVYSEIGDVERLQARGVRPLVCVDAGAERPSFDALPRDADMPVARALDLLRSAGAMSSMEDPLVIIPTSGTTGEPKLATWSQQTMERAGHNLGASLEISGDEVGATRFLLVNSLAHGLGLTNLACALQSAATICVSSQVDSKTPLAEARELDFVYSFMTPRVMVSLRNQWLQGTHGDASARLLGPSAKCIAFAGAPSSAEVVRLLLAQGVDVVDLWGAGETGNIAGSKRGSWEEGYIGRPFPGIEVKVGDNDELLVRARHLMLGYHGDDELTRAAYTEDGFLKTGDAGEIAPDGRVRLTGRLKDVFNTFEGSNIYPSRIESLLEAISWVRQAALIGDRLPFMTALVVVSSDQARDAGSRGLLEPERHPALYERAQREIARVNESLELIEKIQRFLVFAAPFDDELYRVVTVGKVQRDRAGILAAYADPIARLYGDSPPPLMCVPA